ncbi:MAG TPA: hypothetical protein VJ779_01390 [Acetobacteraceae bacterium]|jgi:hypothetical protein|nr:hypothetical protein [Acetobacteraceae bacterium]
MKILLTAAALTGMGLALAVSPASAAGCLSGAAVGAAAGHLAGHGVLGGVAGCAVGHHHAKTVARREQQKAYNQGAADAANASNPAMSGSAAATR